MDANFRDEWQYPNVAALYTISGRFDTATHTTTRVPVELVHSKLEAAGAKYTGTKYSAKYSATKYQHMVLHLRAGIGAELQSQRASTISTRD